MVEIKASRPYKALRRRLPLLTEEEKSLTRAYEAVLKSLSIGIICLGLGLGLWRLLP
jgi:hypothetical protein